MNLGVSRQHRFRSKATPEQFQGHGPVRIEAAYSELSHHAFASWLRLMVEPQTTLRKGRPSIARLLGYGQKRSNEILLQLRRKGYIDVVNHGPGRASEVIVQRRCLVSAQSGFARLSNAGGVRSSAGIVVKTTCNLLSQHFEPSYPVKSPDLLLTSPLTHVEKSAGVDGLRKESNPLTQPTFPACQRIVPLSTIGATLQNVAQNARVVFGVERHKFVTESDYFAGAEAVSGITLKTVPSKNSKGGDYRGGLEFRELLKRKKREIAERKRVERSETKKRRVSRAIAQGRRPGSVDWSQLDQVGKPVISFDPGHATHDKLIEILRRSSRDRTRSAIVDKLGAEFSRIYERYRKDAERRNGAAHSRYFVHETERKHCEEAGIQCVIKGVTPRQVLEYWDKNIRNFTDHKLFIPPLAFLKAPSNVDQVAVHAISSQAKVRKPSVEDRPKSRNSFSELNGLDVRLRSRLEAAGFQTQAYNDRYMLSIQHNAIAIASGKDILLPDGRVRLMTIWASENLYADA